MSDDSQQIGQDEIEKLLEQARAASGAGPAAPTPRAPTPKSEPSSEGPLGQAEIEALLQSQGAGRSAALAPVPAAPRPRAAASGPGVAPADLELLLQQAEQALASIDAPHDRQVPGLVQFKLDDLQGAPASVESATLELIRDVELDLKIEFGRTQMLLEDVLRLRRGSVVPLDKLAGDPVDIFVNGRLIARGEVLVLNDNFCVRVAELIAGERLAAG